jgi:hypothetical protein
MKMLLKMIGLNWVWCLNVCTYACYAAVYINLISGLFLWCVYLF